jgi:hypothetical protein
MNGGPALPLRSDANGSGEALWVPFPSCPRSLRPSNRRGFAEESAQANARPPHVRKKARLPAPCTACGSLRSGPNADSQLARIVFPQHQSRERWSTPHRNRRRSAFFQNGSRRHVHGGWKGLIREMSHTQLAVIVVSPAPGVSEISRAQVWDSPAVRTENGTSCSTR